MDVSQNMVNLKNTATADNTAYTLRAYALALRDIAFGNIVYAGNVNSITLDHLFLYTRVTVSRTF